MDEDAANQSDGASETETSLLGKAAFVSGGSSGIGRAIALEIGERGGRVTICGRRVDRLDEVADQIRSAGGQAHVVEADFSHPTAIEEAVGFAADHWGGQLNILINAAGVALQATLSDGSTDDWRAMLDINVLALAVATREALKVFPQEGGGDVINIGSMSGHRVPGRGGFYSATKFAVRAMTEGLRQELRQAGNLTRVGSVSPGFVDTELLSRYFESAGADRYQAIEYPILKPEEVARVVVEMLSLPRTAEITDVLMRPSQQAT
jgi:NADP-dependent 3-hydroxy acid dehydrogenase YdfG